MSPDFATDHSDLHSILASKISLIVSWIAAALGLGSFMGIVNILVGVLSSIWLLVQLWNYFTFTLPQNRKRLQSLEEIPIPDDPL